jgi:hypothetical protein
MTIFFVKSQDNFFFSLIRKAKQEEKKRKLDKLTFKKVISIKTATIKVERGVGH